MRRYRTLLLILLVVIVPATVLLVSVWLYLGQEAPPPPPESVEAPLPPPEPLSPPPVEVVAAARDLLVGTLLTANDITYVPLEAAAVFSSHMRRDQTEPSAVIGAVVRTALLAGMPLTSAALIRPGQEGFLAGALMPDHRAVTIVVNQETSHAGLIAPGDRVDVIFTMQVPSDDSSQLEPFSRTVLEDIRVVAVNRRVESVAGGTEPEQSEAGRSGSGNTVTLEVQPPEADRLVLATTRGSISLALRPLGQAGKVGWRPATGLGKLLPPPATKTPDPKQVRIQVFRGNNHEEVLLAK
jgi:pilus assembly protein CpaB